MLEKVEQKSVKKEADARKEASKPNGRWVSDPLDSRVTLPRPDWHLKRDECSGVRRSAVHKTKADVIEFTYKQQNKKPEQGRPGKLWLDTPARTKQSKPAVGP